MLILGVFLKTTHLRHLLSLSQSSCDIWNSCSDQGDNSVGQASPGFTDGKNQRLRFSLSFSLSDWRSNGNIYQANNIHFLLMLCQLLNVVESRSTIHRLPLSPIKGCRGSGAFPWWLWVRGVVLDNLSQSVTACVLIFCCVGAAVWHSW